MNNFQIAKRDAFIRAGEWLATQPRGYGCCIALSATGNSFLKTDMKRIFMARGFGRCPVFWMAEKAEGYDSAEVHSRRLLAIAFAAAMAETGDI